MNKYNKKIAVSILGLLTWSQTMAQDETKNDDKLGGDLVKVDVDYIPQTKKAVKIQAVPTVEKSEMGEKYKIDYDFISVGVDNDFEVSQIKAAKQNKKRKYPKYNNYAKAGYGTNANALAEVFYAYEINPEKYLGARALFNSINPTIENLDTNLKNNQLNAEVFYKSESDDYQTSANVGYDMNQFYYYGFQKNVPEQLDRNTLGNIYAHADIKANRKTLLDKASLDVNHFSDRFDTSEITGQAAGNLKLSVIESANTLNYNALLKIDAALVNGEIGNKQEENQYKFTQFGLQPQLEISKGLSTIQLGLKASYHMDGLDSQNSKMYFFPAISALYTISDEANAYAKINGGIDYNSYTKLAETNRFIGYNELIKATKTNLDATIGIKGNLSSAVGYKLEGAMKKQKDFGFMTASIQNNQEHIYNYNNSFDLTYDNLNTFSFNAGLSYLMTKNLDVKWNVNFAKYSTQQEKAWNMPNFKTDLALDYNLFDHKLNLGANLYYIGKRFDLVDKNPTEVEGYIDLNLKAYFQITRRLTAFTHASNLLGTYDYYYKYPTQGATFMGGLKYKF